jgi:hypothetical protein
MASVGHFAKADRDAVPRVHQSNGDTEVHDLLFRKVLAELVIVRVRGPRLGDEGERLGPVQGGAFPFVEVGRFVPDGERVKALLRLAQSPGLFRVQVHTIDAAVDLRNANFDEGAEAQIKATRAVGCDLVMLVLHWGAEWEFYPNPKQLRCAHKFAELGADAIIAQHPHVIQPVEIYQPCSYPDKQVPILYSLGNLTPFGAPPYTVLSLIANLRISTGKLKGEKRTIVTGLEVTPVSCVAEQDDDGSMHAALVPLADLVMTKLEQTTRDYVSSMAKYADLVLGPDWRKQDPAEPHHQWFAAKRAVAAG